MTTTFVVKNASVLNERGEFDEGLDVLVRDGVIADVGRNVDADVDNAAVVDAAGQWLMPGVFDCHAHPAMWSRDELELLRTPVTEWTLAAAASLERTLNAGVTFVRDAGGADAGLRAAIEKEYTPGPTLQISISLLTQTGGQMDGFLPGPGLELPTGYLLPDFPGRPAYRADGADEMRRAVRGILRAGADWIKVCAGSGAHLEGQDWNATEYTHEEIAVAVQEAARAGKRVMADSKTPASIEMCVRAGVASIEHGLFLDEQRAKLMAEHGVWLVPTNYVYRDFLEKVGAGQVGPKVAAAVHEMVARSSELIPIALEYGLKIALGSDSFGRHMHGNNLRELCFLHEAGMRIEDVLLTATRRGAELCGVADRYGRIAPGFTFDALLLTADPSDPQVFCDPLTVGAVYKAGRAQRALDRLQPVRA
jgi:imidazolonepropionase-like amidohydrolase